MIHIKENNMNSNSNSTIIDNISAKISSNIDDVSDPYIETPWKIIASYFKGQHLER